MPAPWRFPVSIILAAAVLASPFVGLQAASAVPLATSVRINEVESSGGTPGDWVELVNTAASAVDLSGYLVKDSDDTHIFTIPANTSIAANGYLALDVETAYGLGAFDSARLFAPDGTTLVDSYSWTAHAATTYGRCPDGTGAFVTTLASTKGAANSCTPTVAASVRINEVESSGGTPGDWVELANKASVALDLSDYVLKDSDDTHLYTIPSGTSIAANGFLALDVETAYGLGSADSARFFTPGAATLIDSYSWAAHAATTYGRCPDGTGAFVTTVAPTKGAANSCTVSAASAVKINEVESSGGTPGDWVELKNTAAAAVDVSGLVVKDSDDTHVFTIPSGTSIAANGYLALDVETAYGLGAADSARLFGTDGTTLIDSYTWTAHASTTYGRCPDGTGAFTTTTTPTKGAANDCAPPTPTGPTAEAWPGASAITTADQNGVIGGNLSGLAYDPSGTSARGTLWAVKNGPSTLYKLSYNGSAWVSDTSGTGAWSAGKALHYTDGTGDPDAEGVAFTGAGPSGGAFVSTERNNSVSAVSRPSVLKFDATGSATSGATSLNATMEWNLTADLPAVAPNSGLEAISWVSDAFLTSKGFVDEHTGAAYNPATYADHGDGLFFVGLEANGTVYAYALNQVTGGYTRVATIASGFTGVMDLEFEQETNRLWAVCDDTCNGQSAILEIASSGANAGHFAVTHVYDRPAGMPNYNNEGFALAPRAECVAGQKPAFWSDDTNDAGFALRSGSVNCTPIPDTTPPTVSGSLAGRTLTLTAADTGSGVASIEYQLDAATAWVAYSAPVVLDGSAHSVRFRATDVAGTVSSVQTLSVPAAAPSGILSIEPQGVARTIAPGGTVAGLGARLVDSTGAVVAGKPVKFTIAGPGTFASGSLTVNVVTNSAGISLTPTIVSTGVGTITVSASRAGSATVALPAITVAAPAPTLTATVSATTAVVTGKVSVTVSATNTSATPVTIVLKTSYGTKTFAGVASGQTVTQTFKSYLSSVPAGSATAVVSSDAGQRSLSAAYSAAAAG
ncbi:lamin tail domain-containing protein [Subtercola boreus]|uniref:lamin tail domain-containing protein n=1 Tax=Subtercola boreus TaxID=120213 RepID=UPI001B85F87A|nr:lamin tail domain-containing protein [Subtercola boreus]